MKPQPLNAAKAAVAEACATGSGDLTTPIKHLHVGDLVSMREAWKLRDGEVLYRADYRDPDKMGPWRSPLHLCDAHCRRVFRIWGVQAQRLQEITEEDAIAEGVEEIRPMPSIRGQARGRSWRDYEGWCGFHQAKQSFQSLWISIHGPGSWDANPWVWAYTLQPIDGGGK